LPESETSEHKIPSGPEPLHLVLQPVPKILKLLRDEWSPDSFLVSFKLETNPGLLVAKARHALDVVGHDLVVGNLLETRHEEVFIVTQQYVLPLSKPLKQLQQHAPHALALLKRTHKELIESVAALHLKVIHDPLSIVTSSDDTLHLDVHDADLFHLPTPIEHATSDALDPADALEERLVAYLIAYHELFIAKTMPRQVANKLSIHVAPYNPLATAGLLSDPHR
jgi:hypothetical protein